LRYLFRVEKDFLATNWDLSAVCRQEFRSDKSQELTSQHFSAWRVERQIELVHIPPGKPI
jgi:hypothetical protein